MNKLELQKIALEVRKGIIRSTHAAKAGHPGGSLSAAETYYSRTQRERRASEAFR